MKKYLLSKIFIYPIKSLGGISLQKCEVTTKGLKFDRRWMIVDYKNNFISQRSIPQMALISTDLYKDKIVLRHKITSEQIEFNIYESYGEIFKANVWDDEVEVIQVNRLINDWLSINLNTRCKLVFMPDDSFRYVDKKYSVKNEQTSLSDGFPFLLIGQSSLDNLNNRLKEKISFDRFRPNFVFEGGEPFEEDNWKSFEINEIKFYPVKPCSRCVIITTNQTNAERNNEPLKVLSEYRKFGNKVMFGQNLIHEGVGIVQVNSELTKVCYKD